MPRPLHLLFLTYSATLLACGSDDRVAPTTGELIITTATTGADPDPDGYSIDLDGAVLEIGASATIQSSALAEGSHTLSLAGIAANCAVAEPSQTAFVRQGETTRAEFAIACAARPDGAPPGQTTPGLPVFQGRIVFLSVQQNASAIDIVDADGTNARLLRAGATRESFAVGAPAMSPDGRRLAFDEFRDNADHLMIRDLYSSQEVEIPVPYFYGETAWSPDGTRLALVAAGADSATEEIWTVNGDGTDLRQLTSIGGTNSAPTWSPDGGQLALTHEDSVSSDDRLYVVQADGSDPHQIVKMPGPGELARPAWSPDGSLIAFDAWADAEGESEIFVVAPRSDATPRRITFSPGLDQNPTWSPDGTSLAFASDRYGTFQIFAMRVEVGPAMQVTRIPLTMALFPNWIP